MPSFYSFGSEYIITLAEFNFFLRFKKLPKDTEHVSGHSVESLGPNVCFLSFISSFPSFHFPSLLLFSRFSLVVLFSFLFYLTSPLSPPLFYSCFLPFHPFFQYFYPFFFPFLYIMSSSPSLFSPYLFHFIFLSMFCSSPLSPFFLSLYLSSPPYFL